ncbi:MAG: class IV adenylate cyclase [Candidatus Woesearchaeota archaeon]|jgi:adenylate cyclase class 2|nr:class IV adenylate cyclase [Candidatus Woesearchaeota archaeon]
MIEVELKARVDNKQEILSKFEELNFQYIKEEEQEDIIFLKNEFLDSKGKIKDGGIVFRIRIVNSKKIFEIKEIDRNVGGGIEYKIDIADMSSTKRIIEKLGFEEFFTIKKQRAYYQFEDFEIALDNVDGLGEFIEVELMVEADSQKEEAKKRCLYLLKKLGLEANLEKQKYGDLIIEKKNLKSFHDLKNN